MHNSGKLLISFRCVSSLKQHRAMQRGGEEENNFLMMLQVSDPLQLCG